MTREAGLTFVYDNDASPAHRFIETTGGGCAFFDFDNDGRQDLFVVQGGPAPGTSTRPRPNSALYRNLGNGRFQDVTARCGLAVDMGYGQGVSAADFDNDGWQDLLVTSYGALHLFRNDRGQYRDVTRRSGLFEVGEPHWNTSAAWSDFDGDGDLDLAICRYVSWFPDIDQPCFDSGQSPVYCNPITYSGDESALYRNDGGVHFTDVSKAAGLINARGRALGMAWLDYNGDGRPDLFLAHDMSANVLLRNTGKGRMENRGPEAAIAVGPDGNPLSGMGVAAADFRGVGREDLFVVNFSHQPRSYFLNQGNGLFSWGTEWAGLGEWPQPFLAFGVESLDFDRDGSPDLVVGNGHINDALDRSTEDVTYRQRQQLLRNRGDGRFQEDRACSGDLETPRVTRGLAVGDFDNDGRPDIVVVGPRQPLQLFRNEIHPERHWIGFRLEGVRSNRDGVGAQVWVESGGKRQLRVVRSGSSYCSRSDIRALFGLGGSNSAVKVDVVWPSGKKQDCGSLQPDGYYLISENGDVKPDPRTAARQGEPGSAAVQARGRENQ